MSTGSPDFSALSEIDEGTLAARLDAVRKSIAHAGEKGRVLEAPVRHLLRDMLPAEYGITTGFVAWHSSEGPRLSSQLDIIIYDAIRSAPLIRFETCDVLPLEAVYGYVEVKAALRIPRKSAKNPTNDSLQACLRQNATLRQMRDRKFCVVGASSPPIIETFDARWLAIRAYVVAFEVVGVGTKNPVEFAARMASALDAEPRSHIHGVLVPKVGFFYARPDFARPDGDDSSYVDYTSAHPLLSFKSNLLQNLATFKRPQSEWAPALHEYYKHEANWKTQTAKRAAARD